MKPTCALATSLATMILGTVPVLAATHRVRDLESLARIVGEAAEPGDVIEIQPGTYYLETDRISLRRSGTPEHPIVIRGVMSGGMRPLIDASHVNVRRCVFSVGGGVHDIVFENLEVCNAVGSRFPDRRTFGVNATIVRRCSGLSMSPQSRSSMS